jgi:hypothetical protein
LGGNTPSVGEGRWSLKSGPGTVSLVMLIVEVVLPR